jgi:hypothetical protein
VSAPDQAPEVARPREQQCPVTAAGPFETEREALDLPSVRAAYAAITGPGTGDLECLRILEDALTAAGVQLGIYDVRILHWLANWEAQTCAVIAGLITRAHAAGLGTARELIADAGIADMKAADDAAVAEMDGAAVLAEVRAVLAAFDWDRDDRQYALERIDAIAGDAS